MRRDGSGAVGERGGAIDERGGAIDERGGVGTLIRHEMRNSVICNDQFGAI